MDGRHDNMGHSAKYGTYTMFCCTVGLIIHVVLVQVGVHSVVINIFVCLLSSKRVSRIVNSPLTSLDCELALTFGKEPIN